MRQIKGKYYKFGNSAFYLKGKDSIDFLDKFITSDLKNSEEKQFMYSVMTDFNGHIIDLILILRRRDDLLIITSDWKADAVIAYLDKYIMDEDVTIEKADFNKSILLFYPFENHEYDSLANVVYQFDGSIYAIKDPLFNGNVRLIYSSDDDISEAGTLITKDEFEYYRISNMIPYSPNELNENILPLECNLTNFISFDKAEYTGKDVIAKISASDNLPKKMYIMKAPCDFIAQEKIFMKNADDENYSDCGYITSTIKFNDKYLALGFLRQSNYFEDNKYYILRDNKYIAINLIK